MRTIPVATAPGDVFPELLQPIRNELRRVLLCSSTVDVAAADLVVNLLLQDIIIHEVVAGQVPENAWQTTVPLPPWPVRQGSEDSNGQQGTRYAYISNQIIDGLNRMSEDDFLDVTFAALASIRDRFLAGDSLIPQHTRLLATCAVPLWPSTGLPESHRFHLSAIPGRSPAFGTQNFAWRFGAKHASHHDAALHAVANPLGMDERTRAAWQAALQRPARKGNPMTDQSLLFLHPMLTVSGQPECLRLACWHRLNDLLPLLLVQDFQQWKRACNPETKSASRPLLLALRPRSLPAQLFGWLESGMLQTFLEAALASPNVLRKDSMLAVSNDIDFGICNLSKEANLSADEESRLTDWYSLFPKLQNRDTLAMSAWLGDAAKVVARTAVFKNCGPATVTLFSISLQPARSDMYYILDDCSLWRPIDGTDSRKTCVDLKAGDEYAVTVLMKIPRSTSSTVRRSGVFQALLIAVYATSPTPAAPPKPTQLPPASDDGANDLVLSSPRFGRSQQEAKTSGPFRPSLDTLIDGVACVVTSTMIQAPATLAAAVDAQPYVPRALKLHICTMAAKLAAANANPNPAAAARVAANIMQNPIGVALVPEAMCAGPTSGLHFVIPEPDVALPASLLRSPTVRAQVARMLAATSACHPVFRGARLASQAPSPCFVRDCLLLTKSCVHADQVVPDVGGEVERTRRLLLVEGNAVLEDSFDMDVFTELTLLRLPLVTASPGSRKPLANDPTLRRGTMLSKLPETDGSWWRDLTEAEKRPFLYRGPDVSELQKVGAQCPGLALVATAQHALHDGATGSAYMLALKVPGTLENRPMLVFGSRVHLAYPGTSIEDVVWVLDLFQTWVIVSAPSWLQGAASSGFRGGCLPSLSPTGAPTSRALPRLCVRFAIDRTPLQRMYMAALLHNMHCIKPPAQDRNGLQPGRKLQKFSLVPPPAPRVPLAGPQGAEEAYDEFQMLGKLPDDPFADSSPVVAGSLSDAITSWHNTSFGGAITQADLDKRNAFLTDMQQLGQVALNAEQKLAVATMCTMRGRRPFALFGPPGTGKTVTVIETALQLLHRLPSSGRMLLCAPENFAADTLCERLLAANAHGVTSRQVLRLVDPRLPLSRVSNAAVRSCCRVNEAWAAFRLPTTTELVNARVVICTCAAAGFLYRYGFASSRSMTQPAVTFNHVLIDEAGQSPLPEALLPLLACKLGSASARETSCMLAGDPCQLGPMLRSSYAASAGLGESLLSRLIAYYRSLPEACTGRAGCVLLVRNYRSHERLLALPSMLFYGSALQAHADAAITTVPRWSFIDSSLEAGAACNTFVVPVEGQHRREEDSVAIFNALEADVVVQLVVSLVNEQLKRSPGPGDDADAEVGALKDPIKDIGVICATRSQAVHLRNRMRQRDLGGVNVGTVDDFQGQEQRVVFVSTVVTAVSHSALEGRAVGILNNARRFNVAVSRAQSLLVVVGHPRVLKPDKYWGKLWNFCAQRGAIIRDDNDDEASGELYDAAQHALGMLDSGLDEELMTAFAAEEPSRVVL